MNKGEEPDTPSLCSPFFILFCSVSALESKLVSQFCEDENGALIYNRVTNGYNGYGNGNNGKRNGYRPVTEPHVPGDGQISTSRGQTETSQQGSQGSSSTRVGNPSAISQYFQKEILSATWFNDCFFFF